MKPAGSGLAAASAIPLKGPVLAETANSHLK